MDPMSSISLRITMNCRTCQISNPLNGIASAFDCYHCGDSNVLDEKFWTWFIDPDVLKRARRLEGSTEGKSGRIMPVCSVFFRNTPPQCGGCSAVLPTDVLDAETDDGRCFCPSCGQPVSLRVPDALCRTLDPGVRYLVGETLGTVTEAATAPVVVPCMSCGGGLTVNGTSRTCACGYCGASNYLPDGLWRQLHPVPRPIDFYFVSRTR